MINLSFAAPSPSLSKTTSLPMPATAPPLEDDGIFARSLDRMQAPPAPAPPPASKVKLDNGSDRPDAADNDGDATAESKRALEALGAMQRTAAARQAALRSAAQAAESAKALKGTREGGGTPVADGPVVPPTEFPAGGPDVGPDCEFHPDTTPTDNPGAAAPPTTLPAEMAQPKHKLPAQLPPAGEGAVDRPPRMPPLVDGDAADPRLSAQPPTDQPSKGAPIATLPNAPSRFGPPVTRPGPPAAGREDDKAGLGTLTDTPIAKGAPALPIAKGAPAWPIASGPSAPLMPIDPGSQATGPSTLPALLPAGTLRATAEALSNTAAQNAAAALAAVLPGTDNLRSEATVSGQLQARPGSTEFAEQLSTQVAVWAKDGVQRASLQLNPLELGPVSVQIQLDGNGAQVSLAADLAATRLALEQALPSLASSLREAGLTLTGGGVFDQARQQAGADGNGTRNGNPTGADTRGTMPALESDRAQRVAMATPRSRGVVDLMA